MPNCEICGHFGNLKKAIVENTMLNVCDNCLKFGKVILIKEDKKENKVVKKIEEPLQIIVPNYNKLIKEAREKIGLKQSELALKLNEKESIIHKLETGNLKPPIALARKLEKFLNIKLIEIYEESYEALNLKDNALTIGDLLKLK